MLITKTSLISGRVHTRNILGLTEKMLADWQAGGLIQNVMPNLSADDREFLMSGTTPEEFDEMFGEAEDY